MIKLSLNSLSSRFILTSFIIIVLLSVSSILVLQSLNSFEKEIHRNITNHTETQRNNSLAIREIFQLMSRLQLLEQSFIYSEEALHKEGLFIEDKLQNIRRLIHDEDIAQSMDKFIKNFNRLIGNSLTLNNIVKEYKSIDTQLGSDIDELELDIAKYSLKMLLSNSENIFDQHTADIISPIREVYLIAGKLGTSIETKITTETEEVVLLAVLQKLDILKTNLDNMPKDNEDIKNLSDKVYKSIRDYKKVIKKMQANLSQRWTVMDDLVSSQQTAINLIEKAEGDINKSLRRLESNLANKIHNIKIFIILAATIITSISLIIFNLIVRRHIKTPIDKMIQGIEAFKADQLGQVIKLNRNDEWNTIEQAFNSMAERLKSTYEQLKKERLSFDYLAHHDPLTGLANRLFAYKEVNELIRISTNQEKKFSLIYLDLDEFKHINDSLGHEAGDRLLQKIADKLVHTVGEDGHVIRLGGDEFMVVLPYIQDIDTVQTYADAIQLELKQPILLRDSTVFVGVSIGICQFPDHGTSVNDLIRNADTAMYQAKHLGKNCSEIYHSNMTIQAMDRLQKTSGIRRAIDNNEFKLVYQPQYDLNTGEMVAAEALIRWQHPELGLLTPDKFLPVAEQTGLIIDIDDWVFVEVAKQVQSWKSLGVSFRNFRVSLNFSGRKFLKSQLSEKLLSILKNFNCQPKDIEIEITEQDIMTNLSVCINTIQQLKAIGFSLAIDDFGTGYSSFSYLKNLPADTIKMDKSFTFGIKEGNKDMAIVKTMISLAAMMNISIIAEGIESEEQKKLLRQNGCYRGQGYHLGMPMEAEEITHLILANIFREIDINASH